MKLQQLRSATMPGFEETRPAYYFAAESPVAARYRSGATAAPAKPLPQDTWLRELPPVDVTPDRSFALAGDDRRPPRWLRVAGLAAAALLALFALGLAASLLDTQRGHDVHRAEQMGLTGRG